jgi:hypothetical protein
VSISELGRNVLGICIAAAILAGCGGSQPRIGAPAAMPQSPATATHAARGKSWMLPEAKSEDLLYATGGCGGSCVLAYPGGKLVGAVDAGGYDFSGDCTDSNGDVFIGNNNEIVEYAHGGTTRIATLGLPGNSVSNCSVDPRTGNLAVVFLGSDADVAVFSGAAGQPALYSSHIESSYCGYDGSGNLFVSGYNYGQPGLSELLKGASDFTKLSVSYEVGEPGTMQWDGKYITYQSRLQQAAKISRLSISGSQATIVGTTRFLGVKRFSYQSWIYDNVVFVPYNNGGNSGYASKIGLWRYPKGGRAIAVYQHFYKPLRIGGVTLSPKTAPDR